MLVGVRDVPPPIEHHREQVDRVEQVLEAPFGGVERGFRIRALETQTGQERRPAGQPHEQGEPEREGPLQHLAKARGQDRGCHAGDQRPMVVLHGPHGARSSRRAGARAQMLFFFRQRMQRGEGEHARRRCKLARLPRLDPGPLRGEGLRERPVLQRARSLGPGAWSPQPGAFTVEQHDLSDCRRAGPREGGKELGTIIVEQHDAALAARPVDDRGAEADHRLIGVPEVLLFDVSPKRGNEHRPWREGKRLLEVRAGRPRPERGLRHGGWLALVEGHPHNLHTGGIQEPHLIVQAAIPAQSEIFGDEAIRAGVRVVQDPLKLRAVGQQSHVGHHFVEFVIEGRARQGDRESLALLEEGALASLGHAVVPEHEAAQQGRAGHEEDEKA